MLGERRQIGGIAGFGRQGDIEVAGPLVQRIVGRAMHREGGDPRLLLEDRCGAVALMDVEINHHRPADAAFGEQQPGRDRDVVEHAKASTVLGEGMVAAAGGVAGQAVLERQAGGQHGAAAGRLGAGGDRGRDRQADPARDRGRHPLGQDRLDIGWRMDQLQPGCRSRHGRMDLSRLDQAARQQMRHELAEFLHRKSVPGRQRCHIRGMMDDRQHAAW